MSPSLSWTSKRSTLQWVSLKADWSKFGWAKPTHRLAVRTAPTYRRKSGSAFQKSPMRSATSGELLAGSSCNTKIGNIPKTAAGQT